MNTDAQIEAILFHKAEPVKISDLARLLSLSEEEVGQAINQLKTGLNDRGLTLIEKDSELTLATDERVSELLEKITKEELAKDLGKASLETLAVILYRGPVARAEIDYVRGVNSSFILRNLMVRGLIERINNPTDSRSYLYRPTFDLLSHLGISGIKELPEYEQIQAEMTNFMNHDQED